MISTNRNSKRDDRLAANESDSQPAIPRLVDVRAAASYLAVSISTLYGWVWQRRISFVKVGRALRFDLCDLDSFIAANKTATRRKPCTRVELGSLVK